MTSKDFRTTPSRRQFLGLAAAAAGGQQEQEDAPKSTGLGARLMTAFAKQLRAEMSSHSEPGKGYTVELRMPRSEREMKATDF